MYELGEIIRVLIKEDPKFFAMRHNHLKHIVEVFNVPKEIVECAAREMESWDLAFIMDDIVMRNKRETDYTGSKVSKSDLQEFNEVLKERCFNVTDYPIIKDAIDISYEELLSILGNQKDDSYYNIVPFYSETIDFFDIDKIEQVAALILQCDRGFTEEDFFDCIQYYSFGLSREFIVKHYSELAESCVPRWNSKYQEVEYLG